MEKVIKTRDELTGQEMTWIVSERLDELVRLGKIHNDPVVVAKRERANERLRKLDPKSLELLRHL